MVKIIIPYFTNPTRNQFKIYNIFSNFIGALRTKFKVTDREFQTYTSEYLSNAPTRIKQKKKKPVNN